MKNHTLSIFIDESGDFGEYEKHAPYYVVALVLHDQNLDISEDIKTFDRHLRELDVKEHAVHTGPLVRRESVYLNYSVEERKKIFNALFNFARKLEFKFSYVLIPKQKYTDIIALTSAISKQLSDVIKEKMGHWNTFNKKIVYYDNGQVELTKIITSVFHALFEDVEFRKVQPVDYKLFQVADLICTLMLLKEKQSFTNSETQFFKNYRDFKKNYLKHIERKIL